MGQRSHQGSGRHSWLPRRRVLSSGASLTAAVGTGLAGCLEGSAGSNDPHLGEPAPFVDVELSSASNEAHVQPPVAHLVDGGTVEWTAVDGSHDVTAYHPSTHGSQARLPEETAPWTSEPMTAGESFDRVFDVEGVYDYVCRPHESQGAVGGVVVGWPDPEGEPALEPPAETFPPTAVDALERRNDRVRAVLEEVHE